METRPGFFDFAAEDVGVNVQPLTSEGWEELLRVAGLTEIRVKTYAIKAQDEARGIVRRYGFGGMLGVMGHMAWLYTGSPAYRAFVKGVRKAGVIPENLDEYFGYGLFVGCKGQSQPTSRRP